MRRVTVTKAKTMLSLIDVACGAFGGLLLISLVLIRVAPPPRDMPSGVLVITIPMMGMTGKQFKVLYSETITVGGAELTTSEVGWCQHLRWSVEMDNTESNDTRRVVRLEIEALRRPVTLKYSLQPGGDFSRVLPPEVQILVAGTAFHKKLRNELIAADRMVKVTGNTLSIRLDPEVLSIAQFVKSEGP